MVALQGIQSTFLSEASNNAKNVGVWVSQIVR